MREQLSALWRELLLLLYPRPLYCIHCGTGRTFGRAVLCPACLSELKGQEHARRFAVRGEIGESYAARKYAGPAGALVRSLKYGTVSEPAPEMAAAMRDTLVSFGAEERPDRITWVPMHSSRRRARPYDHAELLAKGVAECWGMVPEALLRRVRRTGRQASLQDERKRTENVRGAFRAVGSLAGQRILLIDDVYTTGATARECARALREAGAVQVDVLVYALSRRGAV